MFIYIRCGKAFNFVSNITLQDGHEPSIGDTELPKELQIEPAIWFKIFVIDSLWIDCMQREMRWSRKSDTKTGYENSVQNESVCEQSMFEDGELYDFDSTIDELFDELRMLVSTYGKNHVPKSTFCQSLLRMLHCYLLPKVILNRDDIPQLTASYTVLDKHITRVEKSITTTGNHIVVNKNSLYGLRQKFVDALQCDSNVNSYSLPFLENLLQHIKSDNETAQDKLRDTQDEINRLNGSGSEPDDLVDLRKLRDAQNSRCESLIFVRENIENMALRKSQKKRKSSIDSKKMNRSEYLYTFVCNAIQKNEDDMKRLCEKKLKIVSVKNAVKSAVGDLHNDDETLGMEISGQKATDVLLPNSKPETWFTLEERVIATLNNVSKIRLRHEGFCEYVCCSITAFIDEQLRFGGIDIAEHIFSDDKNELDDFLDETGDSLMPKELFSISNIHISNSTEQDIDEHDKRKSELISPLLECMGRLAQLRRERPPSMNHDNEWQLLTFPVKQRIDQLRRYINEHTEQMVGLINEELFRTLAVHNYNKLWVCYESHLYPEIMPSIMDLYKFAYKPVSSTLNMVPGLLPQELDIHDSWIVEMFNVKLRRDKPSVKHRRLVKSHSADSYPNTPVPVAETVRNSRLNFSFKDMSSFYKLADIECEDMVNNQGAASILDVNPIFDILRQQSVLQSTTEPTTLTVRRSCSDSALNRNIKSVDMIQSDRSSDNDGVRPTEANNLSTAIESPSEDNLSLNRTWSTESVVDFREQFAQVIDKIKSISRETTILSKLKQLTTAFRMSSKRVSNLHSKMDYRACCDDMLTVCIMLMTTLDSAQLFALYTDINLMIDFMAPCLRGGIHDCTLMNFQGAFQYIMDYMTLKEQRLSGVERRPNVPK